MIRRFGYIFLLVFMGINLPVSVLQAQSFQYQSDKPGQFIFDNQLEKCAGVDVTSVQNKLASIVEWVRQNDSVIDHPIGFDAMVGIAGYYFDIKAKKEDFGIQSSIYFGFHDFFIDHDGVSKRATGNTGLLQSRNWKNSYHVMADCMILWDCFLIVCQSKKWGF